jgi:protein SCO1
MEKNKIYIPIAILLSFLVFGLFFFQMKKPKTVTLSPTPTGGNFTLHSVHGSVSLSDYKGKLVLLYFGFLSCPDVCPTTLSVYSQAFKELDARTLEQVQFLFIDVDPERDTLDALQKYTAFFHSQFLPISGSLSEVEQVAKLYGATFRKVPLSSGMKYTIDHTASVFLIDGEGKFIESIPHGTTHTEVKNTILKYSIITPN